MSGNTQKLVDYFRLVDVNDTLSQDASAYTLYDIPNGARPDTVSQLLYDSTDYYWTFFILNDHLKNGYNSWPMSSSTLEKYIDDKYKKYIFLTIPVTFESTRSGDILYTGGLNEFPLNQFCVFYDYNQYKKYLASPTNESAPQRAYLKEYNQNNYQLILSKENANDFTNLNSEFKFSWPVFINPYNAYSADYARTEIIKREWLQNVYNWFSTKWRLGIDVNAVFNNSSSLSTLTDQALYEAYHSYVVNNYSMSIPSEIVITPPESAPYYYTNFDGDRISAYEAYYGTNNTYTNAFAAKNYVTNFDYEVKRNNDLSRIKVIRPARLSEFVSRFKELINE